MEESEFQKKRELSESATELQQNEAFKHAILTLRKQWFAEMMVLEPKVDSAGYLTALARRASMLSTLEAIPTELQRIINDFTVAKKRHG
jgi:hypothetical protein